MGHVPSRTIRADLLDYAGSHAGDGAVEDRMQLANGAPAAYWQGMARLALDSLAELDTGEARLHDTRVRLRGVSMETATRARVSADIANVTAPFRESLSCAARPCGARRMATANWCCPARSPAKPSARKS